ncbi:DUF551 domain-containing protein [Salmonella enterica subsp. enterica serovar Give]|nr:DUF551 domain-containing protein [Salmonella enterica]EBY8073383.1 DUF551 domain-containing protein [Salmonella enterica subsp. enterica serovar Manhattan]EDI6430303.1 DUF551 domain-containing protein [Salmonella enterica subsp. enterica serovar Newport]EDJ0579491.1 DUF551 domain-containing protein [Salmonella enterica subsp. enterica serovar Give]EEN2032220.1 DUF551 domain-containing protein [Salmonella enterica subsp. enterica serovar Dublin]
MTTITKERIELFIKSPLENGLTRGEQMELARIALASLEAEPVSQTYKLPELIEGMEVSIDVSTCDADAGNRYFGTVTEVSELDTAKNGYILLVQDAEPNFDVNGNSPVQSPIDHGYRPECECSGCKATARICAELNNEEAEIFADGYNAAMQSFGNSEQLNSPETPDGWISCSERMPEDEQEVIVQNKLGYRYVSYFDEHSGLFFDMPGGNQMNCIEHILVTHWMPLPEPPQEEK